MAVSDSEATNNKLSLESSDLVLVPQPYWLSRFYHEMLLSDKFSHLLFNIYYGMGTLLGTLMISFTAHGSVLR